MQGDLALIFIIFLAVVAANFFGNRYMTSMKAPAVAAPSGEKQEPVIRSVGDYLLANYPDSL